MASDGETSTTSPHRGNAPRAERDWAGEHIVRGRQVSHQRVGVSFHPKRARYYMANTHHLVQRTCPPETHSGRPAVTETAQQPPVGTLPRPAPQEAPHENCPHWLPRGAANDCLWCGETLSNGPTPPPGAYAPATVPSDTADLHIFRTVAQVAGASTEYYQLTGNLDFGFGSNDITIQWLEVEFVTNSGFGAAEVVVELQTGTAGTLPLIMNTFNDVSVSDGSAIWGTILSKISGDLQPAHWRVNGPFYVPVATLSYSLWLAIRNVNSTAINMTVQVTTQGSTSYAPRVNIDNHVDAYITGVAAALPTNVEGVVDTNIASQDGPLDVQLAAGTTAQDVVIVGVDQLDSPLWVSETNPGADPIAPPSPAWDNGFPRQILSIFQRCCATKDWSLWSGVAFGDQLVQPNSRPPTTREWTRFAQVIPEMQRAASRGADEALARMWNQLMHAYNGNSTTKASPSSPSPSSTPSWPGSGDPLPHWLLGKETQPGHETRKQNPFSVLDEDTLPLILERCGEEIGGQAGEWFLTLVDPDKIFRPRGPAFELSDTQPILREAQRVANAPRGTLASPGRPRGLQREAPDQDRGKKRLYEQTRSLARRKARSVSSWEEALDWALGGDPLGDLLSDLFLQNCLTREPPLPGREGPAAFVLQRELKKRPRRHTLLGLASWSRTLRDLGQAQVFEDWLDQTYPDLHPREPQLSANKNYDRAQALGGSDPGPDGYAEALCRQWNKLMHSLNGNTSNYEFPNSMSELEQAQMLRPLLESPGTVSGPEQDVIREVEELTGLQGPQGITMSSVPRETALRGATISTANAVSLLNDLNSPEALLKPFQIRNPNVLVDSAIRPSLFGVGTVRRRATTLLATTEEGASLRALVGQSGRIRPDQVTLNGFKTSDVAALVRLEPENNGDTLATLYLKLWLYTLSVAWRQGPNFLPLGGEPGKFDSFTQLDTNPTVSVGYNDATVWGADCGSAGAGAAFFPYEPASATGPTIAFHVSKATIPANEPYVMVRPSLLQQNDAGDDSINIALLALALAPYPCGIHTVTIDTLDSAEGNAAAQGFIPHSSCVHLEGTHTLNIYLPSDDADGPPKSQAAADSQALVTPKTGPTAGNVLGADTDLRVCHQGANGYTSYGLAEYLFTWMGGGEVSPVDTTTLVRFMKQLAEIFARSQDLRFTWELACTLTARYPVMVSSPPGTPVTFNVNSAASGASQNFFALEPHSMTTDYPQKLEIYDHYLPSTNLMWWNKVMSGAFIAGSDGGPMPPMNYAFDASPRLLQYAIHTVRDYAVTAEHIFTYMQMPREVWNNSFTQQNYVAILDQIRGFFVSAKHGDTLADVLISENGYAVSVLHCRVNGCRPATDMYGHSLWEYLNAPRVGFQGAYTLTGPLDGCTPCVLPDIWVQLESWVRTYAHTPMLSSNKLLTGIHLDKGQVTPLNAGSYTVPVPIENQARAVGLGTVPLLDDRALFNARLVWHTFAASLYTLDGSVYNVSVPPSQNVISQKAVVPDWTVPNLLDPSVLTAKTTWFPFMDASGNRLVVGVSAANGASLMTQIMGQKTTTGVACWLVRNARAMPNVVVDGGGANSRSLIPPRPGLKNDSPVSSAAEETVAPPAQEEGGPTS